MKRIAKRVISTVFAVALVFASVLGMVNVRVAEAAGSTLFIHYVNYDVYMNGEKVETDIIDTVSGNVEVSGISAMVLAKGTAPIDASLTQTNATAVTSSQTSSSIYKVLIIVAVLIILVVVVVLIATNRKKSK